MKDEVKVFEYRVLIDAEKRCDDYWLSGLCIARDYWDAARKVRSMFAESGDKLLRTVIEFKDYAIA